MLCNTTVYIPSRLRHFRTSYASYAVPEPAHLVETTMPILYSAQQIQGHIIICGNSPWFNKRLQLGRTCIKGPKFCLSASNSERYLHKAREQLLHSLISFQPSTYNSHVLLCSKPQVTVTKWRVVIF